MTVNSTRRIAAGATAIGAALALAVGSGGAIAAAQSADDDTGSLTVNGSGVHTDSLASPQYSAVTDPLDFAYWELCDKGVSI